MSKTFYNKYEIPDPNSPITQEIDRMTGDFTNKILAYVKEQDLSLVEVEHLVGKWVSCAFSQETLMKGFNTHKAEKSQKAPNSA